MKSIVETDPLAVTITAAIREGQTSQLQQLIQEHPGLGSYSIQESGSEIKRSLLHIATDWPGHFSNVSETIRLLIEAGANVNATINGPDTETALHWAASSNDVQAIDALLDANADLYAQGAVIAGGDPLEDAIGFQNWEAARRLVERGAETKLGDEAALGLMDNIMERFQSEPLPKPGSITYSFWNACCAGQLDAARFLFSKGANINWIPEWCDDSPLDGAMASGNTGLISWLESNGAVKNKT